MTRRYFIGLLSSFFGCANEEIKPKKMKRQVIDWWVGGASGTADTTADGKQLKVLVGDSKRAYDAAGSGLNPALTGVAWEYNQGTDALDAFTQAGLANSGFAGGFKGDPEVQFANRYYALTGYKPVFCDSHVYGSTIYKTTDSSTWIYSTSYLKGTLYTNMVTKATAALTKLGLTKPKVISITLGANDVNAATVIGDVVASYAALITFLRADFGTDVAIQFSMLGPSSGYPSARCASIRHAILDLADTFDNVRVVFNESIIYPTYYDSASTPVHFITGGNTIMGDVEAYDLASTVTNKDARRVLANMITPIANSTRIAAYSTLMSKSWWTTAVDCFFCFRNEAALNITNEFCAITGGINGGNGDGALTFTANDKVGADGTSQHFQTRFAPLLCRKASNSDFCVMIKTGAVGQAADTLATLFGNTGTGRVSLGQDTTGSGRTSYFVANSTGGAYATDTKVQPNTWYTIRGDGSNVYLYKGSTQVATAAQSPQTFATVMLHIFSRNNSNPDNQTERHQSEAYVWAFMKYSGLSSIAQTQTDIDDFLTSLA